MKIAYYGHTSFAAEINGKHLLFDPFITQNPLAKAVDIKKIKADYILVSHAAYFGHREAINGTINGVNNPLSPTANAPNVPANSR